MFNVQQVRTHQVIGKLFDEIFQEVSADDEQCDASNICIKLNSINCYPVSLPPSTLKRLKSK